MKGKVARRENRQKLILGLGFRTRLDKRIYRFTPCISNSTIFFCIDHKLAKLVLFIYASTAAVSNYDCIENRNQYYGIELCKLYGLMLQSMHNNFVRVT